MLIKKDFLLAGEPTSCANLEFMTSVRNKLEMFKYYDSDEAMQIKMTEIFTRHDRFEYTVTEGDKTLAVMAIGFDPCDAHIGQPVIYPIMACSLVDGLLNDAYRWMKQIARDKGIHHMIVTRTVGMDIIHRHHYVK